MDAAVNLVEQLIRTDPARGEGWAPRGNKAGFRVVHDHGPDRPPCIGGLEMTASALDFLGDDGSHRFSWPISTIREAAINGLYGSALGMFHIKAPTPGSGDTFNFAVARTTDTQLVNRRPDAQVIVQLLNEQRAAAMR